MKNKKLFAILTLVCFMFTLMPVAAFAAPAATDYVQVKESTESTYAEDVYVTAGKTVLAQAVTADATTGAAYYVLDANGTGVQVQYASAGAAASFLFKVPGTYTVYAVTDNGADSDSAVTGTDLETLVNNANSLVKDETVAAAVAKIEALLSAQKIKTPAYVTVEAPESNYTVTVVSDTYTTTGTATDSYVEVLADSGFTSNEQVTIKLENNGQPVVGKVPTITAPDYVTVVPADAKKVVTNAAGTITYSISANTAGNFKVVFGYEDATERAVDVKVNATGIANVEVAKESTNPINKAAGTINTGAAVKFTDANGSVVARTGSVASGFVGGDVKVTVVSQPTTSRLTAGDFSLVASSTVTGASDLVVTTTSDLKVGSYEVKLALSNGKYVIVGFEAAKMGDVVGIRFVQPAATVALNAVAPSFSVQAYDANGVTQTLTEGASNDYVLSAQGKALVTVTGSELFKVSSEEKYIGSTITVLAKTTDDNFVTTTTLEVVDNGMEVVYANNTAEVGVTTTLKANVLDSKGNKVSVPYVTAATGTTPALYDMKIVVLDKPANAYVYANAAIGATAKDINVTFLGSVAGEYKIQTIIVDGNNEFVTGVETITVGGNEAVFTDVVVLSIGANSMIVNDEVVALDVAPYIEAGRTMMQYTALKAFGIYFEWFEETRSVVAEGNGVKVVMTIGSKVAVVNGVEVEMEVAPTIVNGRTVVPVTYITNVFGIVPQCIYAADGTVQDVLFTNGK